MPAASTQACSARAAAATSASSNAATTRSGSAPRRPAIHRPPIGVRLRQRQALLVERLLEGAGGVHVALGADHRPQGGQAAGGMVGVEDDLPAFEQPLVALAESGAGQRCDAGVGLRNVSESPQRRGAVASEEGSVTHLDKDVVAGGELTDGGAEAVAPAAVGVEDVDEVVHDAQPRAAASSVEAT